MARMRTIKPGFFRNEELAETGLAGRVLFAGLWCWADREGRLDDRPVRIRADVFPYDPDLDVDALLDELAQRGFIVRYQANGERYIQIAKFTEHQNPHVREPASTIPAPDTHSTSTVPVTHPAVRTMGSGILDLGSEKDSTSTDVALRDLGPTDAASRRTPEPTTAEQADLFARKVDRFAQAVRGGLDLAIVPDEFREAVRSAVDARATDTDTAPSTPAVNGNGVPKPRSPDHVLVERYAAQRARPVLNWASDRKAAHKLHGVGYEDCDILAAEANLRTHDPFWAKKHGPTLPQLCCAQGQEAIEKAKQQRLKRQQDARAAEILGGSTL